MSRTIPLVASCVICGCVANQDPLVVERATDLRSSITPNGISLNGISPNGISPNGISPNGISPNGISPNGISPNGISPNGISPNGISPNGISPNGISPNGISPNGISPNGITLNGISPVGISSNGRSIGVASMGTPLAGPGIVGSTWTGLLSSGGTVALRLDAAMQGTGGNRDVWSYQVSVAADDGVWRPMCVNPAGNPIFADSVRGSWSFAQGVPGGGAYHADSAEFTMACRGSAIAKCVELGYKPWTGHQRELASCVRALRADYCGDGTPHTVNGTMVNIYDAGGIQADGAAWTPEAEWTPDGAACVSRREATRSFQVAHDHPSCMSRLLEPENSCGTGFSDGVAVITELPPR
jgi:hypothetical protein